MNHDKLFHILADSLTCNLLLCIATEIIKLIKYILF